MNIEGVSALQAEVGTLKELQRQTGEDLHALLPSILDRSFGGEL